MATVEMNRLLLAAERSNKEALLMKLQQLGCVQVTPFEQEVLAQAGQPEPSDAQTSRVEQTLGRVRWAIGRLGKYEEKSGGMLSPRPGATLAQMNPDAQERERLDDLVESMEQMERRAGELKGQQTRLNTQLEQLGPWRGLDLSPADLAQGRGWRQFLGSLSQEALDSLRGAWGDRPVHIEQVDARQDTVYFWAVVYGPQAEAFLAELKDREFVPFQLEGFEGTPAQQADALKAQLEDLARQQQLMEQEYAALARELPGLRVYHDALLTQLDRQLAAQRLVHTRKSFLLKGWVPAPIQDQVRAAIQADFPEAVIHVTPPEPGEEPPVLLHNNPIVAPFETVVTGYALPAGDSVDPTGVMMPFFACFFGMMVSDAGYGLMMALLVPLLIKVMKPTEAGRKLFWVIGIGGVFTVFWGFLFNTWFGEPLTKASILNPLYEPMDVIVLCLALGALHLLAGLAMGAWQHIRRGQYLDVIYDQVSWLMLIAGLGLLALPATAKIGQWLAILGAAIIVVFAGRDKGNNPFKRLISGLGALYNVTGWLSDLLSYMRLFGMGLATGVIGMVINILVRMILDIGPVGWVIGGAVFLGGHLFNAGINILGAYVHASRLQYIEFFGKFFEEGGNAFTPLRHAPRFVRITDAPGGSG